MMFSEDFFWIAFCVAGAICVIAIPAFGYFMTGFNLSAMPGRDPPIDRLVARWRARRRQ